jgi:hypothetical protein
VKKLIGAVGLSLFLIGSYQTLETIRYLQRSVLVSATVVSVETRSGPPKPSQNTPVHVQFTLDGVGEQRGVTHLPLLHRIKEGEAIRVLVDPQNPQEIRLPLLSELWARPITYLLCGILILCGALLVIFRTPNARESKPSA